MDKNTTEITKYDSGLSEDKHNALAIKFNPFMEEVGGLIDTAKTITVATADDTKAMSLARSTRLKLKGIRVDVEKTRISLKEDVLLYGKAIDGMANICKFAIVPTEKALQEKEDYVKREEEKRIAALKADRAAQLGSYDVDSEHFDLGGMTDEAFGSLLQSSKMAWQAKKDAEKAEAQRIENERLAAEKAEADRRKQEAEKRAQLEAENEKLRKAAKIEQQEREKANAEAIALKKADEARKAKEKQDELERLATEKTAEQARLSAPDKEKIEALVDAVTSLQMPSVKSEIAIDAINQASVSLSGIVKSLRGTITEMEA